jgi:hypothetical protein
MGVVLSGISATATSSTWEPKLKTAGDPGVFQADISATASVALQGRANAAAGWITLATLTSSGATGIVLMPQMQVVATITSGTVSAHIEE